MAKAISVVAVLLVLFLLQVDFYAADAIDCHSRCEYRCSKSWKHKMCMRTCNTCCQRCHCVPPGTSGNEDVCPCYANMKTHGGRHKCP